MHIVKPFKLLFTAVLLIVLTGCSSSTKLIKRWHDPDYTGPKLQKVLVLGLFKEESQRRAFESAFVNQIDPTGKQAVAGYTLMPNMEDFDSKEEIKAAVEKAGADSVLITHFKGNIKKAREVPGRVEVIPDNPAYGYGGYRYGLGYGGYYGSTYQTVYRDSFTTMDSIVQLDTQVFSVATEKPVWSGFTKSINPKSGEKIIQELARLITTDMRKNGLIY